MKCLPNKPQKLKFYLQITVSSYGSNFFAHDMRTTHLPPPIFLPQSTKARSPDFRYRIVNQDLVPIFMFKPVELVGLRI